MDEIQREYEEKTRMGSCFEKTIKIRKKKKSLILIRDLMKGRRRAEVSILLRQGLEVFTGAAGLLWSRFMAEQSAVPSAPFAWIGVFAL